MKHNAILILILALALAACSSEPESTTTTATPPEPATTYAIAYNLLQPDAENKNNYEIMTMNLDGGEKRNITKNPDVAWTYHAHGDRIFFVSDRNATYREFYLYEMKYDGNELKKISNTRLKDSWMGSRKGGKELIIAPYKDKEFPFYIIDRTGKLIQKVKPGTPFASDPAFSPDGKTIAFVGKSHEFNSNEIKNFKAEIYTVKPDGSNLRQLTTYPPNDKSAQWFEYLTGPPQWHPTENFISYPSLQNGKYSLYAVTPDGKKQWKLTDVPQNEGWHCWSPDGKWLALELSENDNFYIALMNWETKKITNLTDQKLQFQHAPVFLTVPE